MNGNNNLETGKKSLDNLLNSVAEEETALASLINMEAEKIREINIKDIPVKDVIALQNSVSKVMKVVVKSQIMLYLKLEKVIEIIDKKPPKPDPPCPPVPPEDVACIRTEKVFDSCRKVVVSDDIINLSGVAKGKIKEAECRKIELLKNNKYPLICERVGESNRAKVSFYYRYHIVYIDEHGKRYFTSEPIQHREAVTMSERIGEKGMEVVCEIFLDCTECFPSEKQTITCCASKQMIFKLIAMVQLLVPEHGYCPKPEDCGTPDCPAHVVPEWPLYPPQDENIKGGKE